eukprot:3331921-Amphidinium_carterae.1
MLRLDIVYELNVMLYFVPRAGGKASTSRRQRERKIQQHRCGAKVGQRHRQCKGLDICLGRNRRPQEATRQTVTNH